MAIRAIAFDIDGTLYSSARLYLRLASFGLRNGRLFLAFSAVRKELHRLALDPAHRASRPADGADFRRFQAELAAHRLGIDPESAEALLQKVIYEELEGHFSRIAPYAGVPEALRRFTMEGFRLAALSDFPAKAKLERLGLGEHFELAITSEDSGLLKPAAEPFLDLAAGLGLPPEEILYVGNSPEFDIAGASRAGMPAVLRGRREAPGAILRFTDWQALVDFALPLKA